MQETVKEIGINICELLRYIIRDYLVTQSEFILLKLEISFYLINKSSTLKNVS